MYEKRALQHSGNCLRSMRDCMPRNRCAVTDHTAGRALFLSCNEVSLLSRSPVHLCWVGAVKEPWDNVADAVSRMQYAAGNFEEARSHMAACEDLVEMRGGHQTLVMDGFVSQLIFWFKSEISISQSDEIAEGDGGIVQRARACSWFNLTFP